MELSVVARGRKYILCIRSSTYWAFAELFFWLLVRHCLLKVSFTTRTFQLRQSDEGDRLLCGVDVEGKFLEFVKFAFCVSNSWR